MKKHVRLDERALKEIFWVTGEDGVERIRAITESDAIVAVYRLVYPEWDEIEKVGDDTQTWPACNSKTWKTICRHFQHLTGVLNRARAYDKQVMPGGSWMNYGFTQDETLRDGWVKLAPIKVKVRELV